MVLAKVIVPRISVADPAWRLPVKYAEGDLVELTNADFDRLVKAGAVEEADAPAKTRGKGDEQTVEEDDGAAEQLSADAEHQLGLYAKLTHEKLDQAGRKAKVKFPKGATRQQKAEALVAAEEG